MIKTVIFDMGGVVTYDTMRKVYAATEKEFGINRDLVKTRFERIETPIITNKITLKEFWKRLAKELEIRAVKKLENLWEETFRKKVKINRGTLRIVENVKKAGYKVVCLSNTIKSHAEVHKRRGDYRIFQKVFLSTEIGLRKPDVRIYRYTAKKLSSEPSECVFIDDKKINIEGARKARMKAILFKNADQLEKDLRKYL